MRVSELSRTTGVPVPTIKYYLREGLLPRGEASSPNQASYDDTHVRRLRLIRSLTEVGGLPIAVVRSVLAAVDDPTKPLHDVLGATVYSVTSDGAGDPDDVHHERAAARLEQLVAERDWQVSAGAPARAAAVEALATLYRLDLDRLAGVVDAYGRAAEVVAEADLASVAAVTGRDQRVETALVGTVVGDALLAALRRMAQEHMSAKHFPPPQETP